MLSTVQRLHQQQLGCGRFTTYNACLQRLQCPKENDFQSIWGNDVDTASGTETPIFACKYATKEGYQDYVAMANEDGYLAVYQPNKSTPRRVKRIHENAIFDVDWLANSLKLITGSGDHSARLVNVEYNLQSEQVFLGHSRSVKTIAACNTDGAIFATGARDGAIRVWDVRCNSGLDVVVSADRTISNAHCKWMPSSGHKRRLNYFPTTITAANSVTSLVFQNDKTLISCGSGDGLIKVWDLRKTFFSGRPTPSYEISYSGSTTRNGFSNLAIDNSRNRLYVNCLDSIIYCYNISSYCPEPVMEYTGHQNGTFYVKSALSYDGSYLLSGSSDSFAYIWDIHDKRPIVKLKGHTAEVTCVAWQQVGEFSLITCSDDVKHKIWRMGSEILPENWQIEITGTAQRITPRKTTPTSKKRPAECMANETTPNQPKMSRLDLKRSLENGDTPQSKRPNTGKKLFNAEESNISTVAETSTLAPIPEEEDSFRTPKASSSRKRLLEETTPEETFSPMSNLPNFVMDGCAPHLHFSPQKRLDKDWLTKIRLQKNLVKEMQAHNETEASSPKTPKLDHASPRQRIQRRRNSRSPSINTGPLLKYFRVGGNNSTSCSPKSPLITTNNSIQAIE